MTEKTQAQECRPWWTFGYVWLVIAGPAAVVVASAVTVWLNLANPEVVLATEDSTVHAGKAHLPALQGRNHAATPVAGAGRRAP
ncbi:nitrogen fixation protein FixH [Caenimonas terrae]|uniref:Nitrogen fixation protein FixH n=1 Tax=Caenimonas terrae TaxID=696074 RepID=A0ABW0N8T3_9BURK